MTPVVTSNPIQDLAHRSERLGSPADAGLWRGYVEVFYEEEFLRTLYSLRGVFRGLLCVWRRAAVGFSLWPSASVPGRSASGAAAGSEFRGASRLISS